VLAALAKQEAAKGLALPDAERLAPNRKAALQLLLRLPHCNAAVALLLAERFDSLRHVLTRLDVLFPFFFLLQNPLALFFVFLFAAAVPARRSPAGAGSRPDGPATCTACCGCAFRRRRLDSSFFVVE